MRKEFFNLLLIATSAVPGALLRWQLHNNFLANIIGAAVLGFVFGLPINRQRRLIASSFCGALTTFSGWLVYTIKLFQDGSLLYALALLGFGFGFGLLAAVVGFYFGQLIKNSRHLQ